MPLRGTWNGEAASILTGRTSGLTKGKSPVPAPPGQHHGNAALWLQGDAGQELEFKPRRQGQMKSLCHRGQNQRCFHLRERSANAGPLAASEGKVRELRQLLFEFLRPSLRTELVRLIIEADISVNNPWLSTRVVLAGKV